MQKWYYVYKGERKGPVEASQIKELYLGSKISDNDYVWTKGYENWLKIKDVEEFSSLKQKQQATPELPKNNDVEPSASESIPEKISFEAPSFKSKDPEKKIFFIKTGADRGGKGQEYGPFSLNLLKKLYTENRINSKTFAFTKGLESWTALGEFDGFQEVFNAVPEPIKDEDKRAFRRKPFIARMFIENNNQLFEGICRDVSIGGMQVLVDHFPAKTGERISINVHPENTDHHFTASGEIVRTLEGGLGFSFRFINLSDSAVRAINSYISNE